MTIAYLCILLAALLPLVCAGVAKFGARGFDNHDPRAWLAQQEGYRKRANAAQANSWEAFPFFAAAVLVAHQSGARQGRVDALAAAFIVVRVAYVAAYVTDRARVRTLIWATGLALTIAIFFSASW